ncbi:MAG: regulatory protein RecX [Clostridia bacterium]|nr:regulatory protein RecX [Clostridia bacterium]NCC43485.1 regulatory protein RecX [Clostridia bacterium]
MMITEIIPVTKQKYKIVTDEQLAFVLYKGELSRYRLREGRELPEEVYRKILEEILIKRAKLRAMHLLEKMDYTQTELQRKLMRGGYTQEAVDIAVAYVKSFHYIDDERYVSHYMNTYAGRKSRRQMEFDLEKKGVSKDLIKAYGESHDEFEDETSLIRKLLEKRCRNPKDADDKEKRKHYGYLLRKGFKSSEIQQVFNVFFERFS